MSFFKIQDAKAQLDKLTSERATLQNQLNEATARAEKAEATVAELTAAAEELKKDLESETKARESAQAQATDFEAKVKEAGAAKAVEIAAAQGIPPVPEGQPAVAQASPDDLWEQYKALQTPKERRAFYLKNYKAMAGNHAWKH